jgi:hypothetical protein
MKPTVKVVNNCQMHFLVKMIWNKIITTTFQNSTEYAIIKGNENQARFETELGTYASGLYWWCKCTVWKHMQHKENYRSFTKHKYVD